MKRLCFGLLLLASFSVIPKELQTLYEVPGVNKTIWCRKLKWGEGKTYTLTQCNNNVKEIINATNIVVYE